MTTYKALKGKKIKFLASDPPATAGEGQVWYNSVAYEYKSVTKVEAWASGGNLGTARRGMGSGNFGSTQTAALVFAGGGNPYSNIGIKTEEYNGTAWSEQNDMSTYRYVLPGAGSQTAALGMGGYRFPSPTPRTRLECEEYDGTSWTNATSLPARRQAGCGFGTQTAAINAAGYDRGPPVTNYATTLSYDGTNWTVLNSPSNVNTPRSYASGTGTQTAGLMSGGNTSPNKQTEEWNGSTWSNVTSSTSSHVNATQSSMGIQTAALLASGGAPLVTACELYDGTNWSNTASVSTARYEPGSSGTSTAGLIAGGYTNTNVANTEEYTNAVVVKSITDS